MRRLLLALVTASSLLLVGVGSAHADDAAAPPSYVNLGDSYSSGAGIAPFDPAAPASCSQSLLNWAHDIAGDRGYDLTDVSCSGATTDDFTSSQGTGIAPQLDALSADTDLVTMTIGGNDGSVYSDAFLGCAQAGLASGGQGNPCEQKYGTSFLRTIRTVTRPNLEAALRAVRDRAPNARVAISGYLQILPTDGTGCFPVVPVAAGDVAYLDRIEAALNKTVRQVARSVGVSYLDVTKISAAHNACTAPGTRWVEPLAPVNAYPLHPNLLGEQAMARNAIKRLGL